MKCFHVFISILVSWAVFITAPFSTIAQTPDEHAKHHPQQQQSSMADSTGSMTSGANNAGKGGMSGMGEMMEEMGVPPKRELYPSMMQVPDMTPEKMDEIKRLAKERVNKGEALMSSGLEKLKAAVRNQNATEIQEANEQIRLGQSLFQSGLAAQQALSGYKDLRNTALQWFKQEMNLSQPETKQPHGFFGLSWFHYMIMALFALFAITMILMYFHKMKRANALVVRLAGSSTENIPLPGEALPPTAFTGIKNEPVEVNPDIAPSKSNSWSGNLKVAGIFVETPTVKTFRLTDPASGKLPFNYLPGQFVTVTVSANGVPVKRSYTIASSPTLRDCCEITVKHEEKGTVSHYLHTQVHEGDLLQLTGPSGKFTFTGQEADSIVLIAGGVGVTPMMSVIRYLTDRSWKGDIYFFFSCKDEDNIIFREEIEYLQKRFPNLHVFIILNEVEDNSKNAFIKGRISKEVLYEHVPEIISRRIHICGPPPMMDAVKEMLEELQVPKENVITEIFAGKLPPTKTEPLTPEEAGKTAVVTFARSKKTAVLPPQKTILEASEDVGVNIDYSCRVGTCGVCKTRLLAGRVKMDVEDALTNDDKNHNIILACQAKATEDVSVDA
ncbi:2Fe-2S iron-sulfur cluster binding domain-containing protein [Ilyomonas limi]|uniref:2Fe-2S iron-sulfur cluster binding domain-containing protein n=1 Tax=Ilyomonas limi TaxID=2575867 RepID=A0A4U3KV21_9BACT|nr:2Fe-2S iron-sulfur cluster-binding protein [Ilyomonas limi]TKK66311.1 2Fe-2S iron-sulfur cluster binding domain-containing protein [Ilyomonas limi]